MRRVVVVTPRRAVRGGNRVTALRWARHLRALGWSVRIVDAEVDPRNDPRFAADVLVALNAWHSRAAIEHHAQRYPKSPLIVVATGTDVYRAESDAEGRAAAVERSFARASAIAVLQPFALDELSPAARAKAHVVYQSVALHDCRREPRTDVFEALVLANVRAVKDPLLAARAARLVDVRVPLVVTLAGELLEPALAADVAHEVRTNPRFTHVGPLAHGAALARLARAGVLVSSSLREGGPIAVVEAAALGVPVLATRVPGHVGLLGGEHPGLFESGAHAALARLLERCAADAGFRASLVRAGEPLARLSRPEVERASIELLVGRGDGRAPVTGR